MAATARLTFWHFTAEPEEAWPVHDWELQHIVSPVEHSIDSIQGQWRTNLPSGHGCITALPLPAHVQPRD